MRVREIFEPVVAVEDKKAAESTVSETVASFGKERNMVHSANRTTKSNFN